MHYQGKKCVVLGLGRSGLAAARLLLREGASVTAIDSHHDASLQQKATLLRAEGMTIFLGDEVDQDRTHYDLGILSPGIEPTAPLVRKIHHQGIPIIGELELAYSLCTRPLVAITGTNGKTTTTELTTRALQGAGWRAIACGNIGLPFSEAVLQNDQVDLFVVEASSFQLETISTFRPKIAVWLNLSPNHLDRYSNMEEYRAAKLSIFKNLSIDSRRVLEAYQETLRATSSLNSTKRKSAFLGSSDHYDGDVAIIPASFDRVAAGIQVPCITFGTGRSEADFFSQDDSLSYRGEAFLRMEQTCLRGGHNAENLMAAFAVGTALGAPLDLMIKTIEDYRAPAHRCELVAQKDGIIWINDSKSTTLDSMEKAILSVDRSRPILLIAGGKNKGSSFASLLPLLQERVKAAILLGELKDSMAVQWSSLNCHLVENMEEAVSRAGALAQPGETVLLSPGTSSYDTFSNYEERGDCFKTAVHTFLKK